jgi:ABC-type branched-subunit amino acid transport system substrate-binding protein
MIKSKNRTASHAGLILLVIFMLFSCVDDGAIGKRARKAAIKDRGKTGDIVIGIVTSSPVKTLFLPGVELAVEEINRKGGVLGRNLKTLVFDDRGRIDRGQKVAKKLAANTDVIAVIGHRDSEVAIAASIIYEKAGILFISHEAMNPIFTEATGQLTFSNIITEKDTGSQMGIFFETSNICDMVILAESSGIGTYERIAASFWSYVSSAKIDLVAFRSYFMVNAYQSHSKRSWEQTDFLDLLWSLKKDYEFKSIFIAGDVFGAGKLIKQARMLGIDVPILAVGEGVDTHRLREIAGEAVRGVIVASMINPENKKTIEFIKNFRKKFGTRPEMSSAQGYDAVSVLTSAIEKCGSTVPIDISRTLRFFTKMDGVTGPYSFTPQGNITGKKLYFNRATDGKSVLKCEPPEPEKK